MKKGGREKELSRPVIPDRNRANLPFEPDLKIVVLADMLEKVGKEVVGLVEGELVDSFGEAKDAPRDQFEQQRVRAT